MINMDVFFELGQVIEIVSEQQIFAGVSVAKMRILIYVLFENAVAESVFLRANL